MSGQVQMAPGSSGVGGVIYGNFGTYTPASDGTYSVDTRDAPSLLAMGMGYVKTLVGYYTTPLAPAAAAAGAIVASVAISNATLTIAASPDVMRPVAVEVGAGTGAITAGQVAVTYVGNDGQSGTDTVNLAAAASSGFTQTLSRGVMTMTSAIVTGFAQNGTGAFIRLNTLAQLSMPVGPNSTDFSVKREYDAGATVAVGTLSTALGSIAPTNAPNATRTYSFAYDYTSPVT
jgi:hypothetical protein